jgi:tetratricopeptide (TPR) repeat protein
MFNWLRMLLMMFYAPVRGMSEVRDRAPLAPAMLLALLAQFAYTTYGQWPYLAADMARFGSMIFVSVFFRTASTLLFIAIIFVPATAFFANLFERRGSFSVVIRQEYAALAATIFYAWAVANLVSIPLAVLANVSGFQAAVLASSMEMAARWQAKLPPDSPPLADPRLLTESFWRTIMLPLFGLWSVIAVREVFRAPVFRAITTVAASAVAMFIFAPVLMPIFSWVFASPFLLLLLFFFLRGYIGDLSRNARARASFKQNLEAATLNPADASAHYNLGLIHQQRNQLEEARARFHRAIEIDADEVDAHYQLGRIARAENRPADAIGHFEQVVARDPAHAQHEIWREIGATYIAAEQFDDARDALERFLENRPSDPEGLYLMGRAFAGLGLRREAASSMQACIEAVKTAPAYKYRTDKRWLNEAQQFLKTVASDG